MKQIILTILLISNIVAQTTQHDIYQFKKVIKNGWSEHNQTLNQKIIDLGKVEIPWIIENLEHPLKPDANKSNIPPFPKFILHRDDYTKLCSYSKYLESQNKVTDVIQIYTRAYRGLNNIRMSSYIPLITLIAFNIDINKSLDSSLRYHIFTKEEKMILYKKLSSILILDTNKLIETIEAEKNITLYFVKISKVDGDYIVDKQHLPIFKKLWKEAVNRYYPAFISAIENNTIEKFIEEKKRKRKLISLATHLSMKLLKLKLKLYNNLSIKIDNEDYIALSKYRINKDLSMNTTAIDNTTRDYFKMIENNKKLLKRLKEDNVAYTQDPYYLKLKKECHGSSCCLASWKNIVSGKVKALKHGIDTCPVGYHANMLKCIDSYAWCEKDRDKNKR
ncbi:MAG: hypothetical protein L3J43_09595 [Sulfurovum sp.]|nr:hypothetical protein [Sulfurovum sp.]